MSDYYKLLGISRDANPDEIKKKYRKLSRQYHPDLNPDNPEAEEKFKQISEAYGILSNKDKRQEYDMHRHGIPPPGFEPPGFGPVGFESIFEQFFGQRRRPGPPRPRPPPEPPSVNFKIPIEKLINQSEIKSFFSLKKEMVCDSCSGIGADFAEPCAACNGTGATETMQTNGNVVITRTHPCSVCQGSGKRFENPCSECDTTGVKETVQRYEVKLRCKEIK